MLLPDDPVLHVGDLLRIVCPESPEICVERRVALDGTIDLPRIGPVVAVLRHPSAISHELGIAASTGVLPLRVEVVFLGTSPDEITIWGAVGHPLRVYAPQGIDFDRLLRAADTFPEADRTLIDRHGKVRPGTSIDVPVLTAERRINVLGAVVHPTALAPSVGLLLGSALEAAGGLSAHGDGQKIVVVRSGESIPVQLPADAAFRLLPGDVVRVGLLADRHYVLVKGLVAHPGSVEYAPGMTVTRALAAAGGLLPDARAGTLVWQTGSKSYRLSVSFLLAGRIPDPVLGAEDTIVVEATKP